MYWMVAIFKSHLLQQEKCCFNTALKLNSFDFDGELLQYFLVSFCYIAQKKV